MAAPGVDELLQCLKDSHATSDAVSAAFDPHDFVFNKRGYQSVIRINGCPILPPLVSLLISLITSISFLTILTK